MCSDAGQEATVTDGIPLDKDHRRIEHLGVTLAEAKQRLRTLQQPLLQQQVDPLLSPCAPCADCGALLQVNAQASRSFRPVFGPCTLPSPRLEHCDCTPRQTSSCRPLAALLTESVAPELRYMEAQWSSRVSYGMSRDALKDFLPLEATRDGKTVRYETLKVAKRLAAAVGDAPPGCIAGHPSEWGLLPHPEGACNVGLDGGAGRNWGDQKPHFEVSVGKSVRSIREAEAVQSPWPKRRGVVQTLDTKPKRRRYEGGQSQGLQMNQAITLLSDGDDKLRALQLTMSPKAPHSLDWFHRTMPLTV